MTVSVDLGIYANIFYAAMEALLSPQTNGSGTSVLKPSTNEVSTLTNDMGHDYSLFISRSIGSENLRRIEKFSLLMRCPRSWTLQGAQLYDYVFAH